MNNFIEFEGTKYELKFNLERLKLIEDALGKPIISVYTEHKGAFSFREMETVFQLALKETGADTFCSNKRAKEIFNTVIQLENGYRDINNLIAVKLQENCPFLFPKIS